MKARLQFRVGFINPHRHLDEPWMRQIARNATMEGCGSLRDCRYLLHDRDTKYTQSFRLILCQVELNRWYCRRAG